MIRSNLRLLVFAIGLLLGIQLPGFYADYVKRVDAHRLEAARAIEGFRKTADGFFNGDLNALVAHYRDSTDPVFKKDAEHLAELVARSQHLDAEWQALQGPWYQSAWHMLVHAERELVRETLNAYDFQIVLNPPAIAWALGCGFVLTWLIDGLWLLLTRPFHNARRREAQPSA